MTHSTSLWQPNHVYLVPLTREALEKRVLEEATRLRDAFPTGLFRLSTRRAPMVVPYTDGFDLLCFPLGSQPHGWLSVKLEPTGSGCRLHVSRRKRPRPERAVFIVFPLIFVVFEAMSFFTPSNPPAFVPFLILLPFTVVVVVMSIIERSQERRLLQLLGTMFPTMTEELPAMVAV